ncbi:14925_t:CDS:2 [Entrophospora sp. SA101]|nr:14925_t:CDS:2 [Entrophospora sp. SA101]
MSNNQSTINTLRELNSRLASEITELGKENVNIKAENIIKLKQAIEENAMLKIRFEELEKKNKTDTTSRHLIQNSILQPSTRSELSAQKVIITGSTKFTAQNIADLFVLAIKVRQKEILCCWYCYYKAYEDRIEDIKRVNKIDGQSARSLV